MSQVDAAARIAGLFDSRFLQGYVKGKVRTDPVYGAVLERLRGHEHPIVDVGCGIGVLAFYLREHGVEVPISGIDHDKKKIEAARLAAKQYRDIDFAVGDAGDALPSGRSVLMLDLLHYFEDAEQARILTNAASGVPPGGVVIIRDALRDNTMRYRATMAQESFSRVIRWLKADRLNFPTRETIVAAFDGWQQEAIPLWGRTPFNNYLFVFRRVSSGTTNA